MRERKNQAYSVDRVQSRKQRRRNISREPLNLAPIASNKKPKRTLSEIAVKR